MTIMVQHKGQLFPQFQYPILRTASYQLLSTTDNSQVSDDIKMSLGWVFQ